MALVGVIGWPQETNVELVDAWVARGLPARLVNPATAECVLQPGDVALGRLDVTRTLDGVEAGLQVLGELEQRGVTVLNTGHALLCAHDKLLTASYLEAARLPHPRTFLLDYPGTERPLEPPLVLKPRFGSWGADVFRCRTHAQLGAVLDQIRDRRWFRRHGAIVQELVPNAGHDLRLVVAGGRVIGALRRVAAPGEWRTNAALGGTRVPAEASSDACELGVAAAASIGADLVGVDLFPVDGAFVVLELNGAVEFDELYSLSGGDVYLDAANALRLLPAAVAA